MDPNKFHVLTAEGKKITIIISVLFFLIVVPILSYLYYQAAANRPSQTEKEVTYEIQKGDDVFTTAEGLFEKNAINSKFLFILYMFIHGYDKTMQAGVYTIKAGTSVAGLAGMFQHGFNDVKVTFKEGWRSEEIAREASAKLSNVDYKKFVETAKPNEGYLFPDTYFFQKNVLYVEVISEMRNNFDLKTQDILTPDNLAKVALTKEQAVILASIVEREASNSEDRAIIAGILMKRLKEEMKLDVDATVQYAVAFQAECQANASTCTPIKDNPVNINWWPSPLTAEDLNIDSPFNTRKVMGLPPTPISNPGLSAISAVINPKVTDYYYYLVDSTGGTHYARTLDEHNVNVQKYLSQ